jgi:hypothetical protein
MKAPIRVAVTGAAGNIGYSLLWRIASGDCFGPISRSILQLLEVTPALEKLSTARSWSSSRLARCRSCTAWSAATTSNVAFGDADADLPGRLAAPHEGHEPLRSGRRQRPDLHRARARRSTPSPSARSR